MTWASVCGMCVLLVWACGGAESKKDVRDMTDLEIEQLYEQWEANDEPLPEDELPEHKRPRKGIDLSKLNLDDPESMLQATKKGQTVMMFAQVAGSPSDEEMDRITGLWQSQLYNAHIECQRYIVGSGRVLYVLQEGSLAWRAKDFLLKQDQCSEVTLEGKQYPGKGAAKTEL